MPSILVTLVGGSPWGFRIQGGRGTGLPLRLSKVNPGSKASYQGLKEGDFLKMVNGYLTDGLSQMDVQNIIKETGTSLTLEVERDPVMEAAEQTFTTTKTLVLNGVRNSGQRTESNINGFSDSSPNAANWRPNGSNINCEQRGRSSSLPNGGNESTQQYESKLGFTPTTVITDEPPPHGAVLLEKKVTVDGDRVHTDKYYAIPVKEVLKEKTSTTKFIPAPPKYEGIGPTEDGVPIGLRNSVKKENMHNWYKTMFKSLHKADNSNDTQEYIIGYSSEPETGKTDKMLRKKSATLDNRVRYDNSPRSNYSFNKQDYNPPSAKSSIEVYNVRPRLIEDYEPGHSSVTDDEITIGSRRFLPPMNVPKSSYEFKNGYEPDNNLIKKADPPECFDSDQQKMWYREIQRGGDIPQFGLGKQAPERPKEPSVGPMPPPPIHYSIQPTYQQATRPLTLPAAYANENGNSVCQQINGYEMQIRQALHSEMQQRISPSSHQLSPSSRSMIKSPARSPELKIPARALFDFKTESPKEIPLRKGDMVLILRQLDKNWYEGECRGVVGIFPISYVEIVPPEHAYTPVKSASEGKGKALYDFVAQTPIELSMKKGDSISLVRRVDSNWFEACTSTKKGIIPISYIQVLQEPTERNVGSQPVSPKEHASTSRSNSEMKDTFQKVNFLSSTTSTPETVPLANNVGKLQYRGKKGSSLIEPVMYRALYGYAPQNSDELELLEGDTVYVVEMCDDGWFVGTSVRTGVFGIFPGNYVERV